MYIMNRHHQRRGRKTVGFTVALLAVGLTAAVWAAIPYLKPQTTLGPTPDAKITKVLGAEKATKQFQAGPVSLSLPDDWEAFTASDGAVRAHSWRNTKNNKGMRVISLYVDNVPRDMAVNRLLVVQPNGSRLVTVSGVSDNCSEFNSEGRTATSGDGRTPARWQNVSFICDSANYLRNVVATNSVSVTGASGTHELLLTYNDADATPRFDIFTSAVESVQLH